MILTKGCLSEARDTTNLGQQAGASSPGTSLLWDLVQIYLDTWTSGLGPGLGDM